MPYMRFETTDAREIFVRFEAILDVERHSDAQCKVRIQGRETTLVIDKSAVDMTEEIERAEALVSHPKYRTS